MLKPLQKMVEYQLELGFPMELVEQHLSGGKWREGETGEKGSVLKYSYKKRRYIMVPPKKQGGASCKHESRLTASLRAYKSSLWAKNKLLHLENGRLS
jgi:hypothetical protein